MIIIKFTKICSKVNKDASEVEPVIVVLASFIIPGKRMLIIKLIFKKPKREKLV
jgi:hypothetical protein